jgi:chromosomal replication initiation ATPase DnaA
MTANNTLDTQETLETELTLEEKLAVKLGYSTNKTGLQKLRKDLLTTIAENMGDNINSLESIAQALTNYKSNKLNEINQVKKDKFIEKIENAIKECEENGVKPTISYLSTRYGMSYKLVSVYALEHPDLIAEKKVKK